MSQRVAAAAVLVGVFNLIWADEKMLGPADTVITRVEQCPEPGLYPDSLLVERRKISRTLDAFNGTLNLGEPLDDNTGFYVDIDKNGDGGFKQFYVLDEGNICGFLMEWVEENFKRMLESMGAPTECPLPANTYTIENFTINYEEFPENMTYGEFRADAYFVKTLEAKRRIFCLRAYIDVTPKKKE